MQILLPAENISVFSVLADAIYKSTFAYLLTPAVKSTHVDSESCVVVRMDPDPFVGWMF